MAVSKVILNGATLMDTTDKTVSNDNMLSGETALKNDGTTVTGNIIRRDSTQVRVTNNKVDIPKGYYGSSIVKIVSEGTAGTPTATKGTVSNHSVSVTPSVTNTTGYITGGTKNGTAVTVSASELVSGTKSITENDTGIDVTNYAAVDVNVESSGGSSYELIYSEDVAISTTSTSASAKTTFAIQEPRGTSAIYYIKIRDKAGKRNGYFFGADQWVVDILTANGDTSNLTYHPTVSYGIKADGTFAVTSTAFASSGGFGVYLYTLTTDATPSGVQHARFNIYARYDSYLGTIDGTFSIEVYKLKWPGDISPLV